MASGFTTLTNEHLIQDLWSNRLRELLMDDLYAMKFVKLIEDFSHGAVINIPSLGEAETADFAEGQAIKYNKMDTGNFQFSFDQYKYSAHSISEKFKRDSFYANEVISSFVPRQHRALMEAVETRVLSRGPSGQTAGNLNIINEANHRWIGSGVAPAPLRSMAFVDFAKARIALTKANVPMTNLVAIVDPSVEYTLMTNANVVSLMTPMPMWEGVIREGMSTGFKFRFNLYGFDVYVSNYLPRGIVETVGTLTSVDGIANQFFSATPGDTMPIIGGFRQMPTVHSEFNKDLQQNEYLTIAEYGFKLYRPENMVVVITEANVV